MKRHVTAAAMAMAIALISAPNVTAFDDLLRLAPTFPTGMDLPYVFDYTAPRGGFAPQAPTRWGPADEQIAAALMQGEAPDAVTGVDFSAIRSVFSMGEPPSIVTVLFGPAGFAAATPAALAGRGFEKSMLEGLPVLAQGDDHAIDLANAREPDPFGEGLGKSQRILLGGDFLIRTSGWTELRATVAALAGPPSLDANLWIAIVRGLRAASGDNAHLDIATGFSAIAFLDPGPSLDKLLTDPAGAMKSRSKAPPQENIVFPFAVFAVTQNADRASLQIALPFGSEAEATNAGQIISDRIVAHPHTPSRPRIDIEPVAPYSIVVLSLDFPVAEASAARDLYSSWISDIFQRQFTPLTLGF